MIDFNGMHTAIKESIEDSGFKYVPLNNWVNLQRDIFPANWIGRGFSIRFYVDSDVESESHYSGYLRVNLEFALDAVNDNYLDQMADMMTAVSGAFTALSDAGYEVQEVSENWFTFISENILDTLFVTFDQIQVLLDIS
jgi:hypothetical protein